MSVQGNIKKTRASIRYLKRREWAHCFYDMITSNKAIRFGVDASVLFFDHYRSIIMSHNHMNADVNIRDLFALEVIDSKQLEIIGSIENDVDVCFYSEILSKTVELHRRLIFCPVGYVNTYDITPHQTITFFKTGRNLAIKLDSYYLILDDNSLNVFLQTSSGFFNTLCYSRAQVHSQGKLELSQSLVEKLAELMASMSRRACFLIENGGSIACLNKSVQRLILVCFLRCEVDDELKHLCLKRANLLQQDAVELDIFSDSVYDAIKSSCLVSQLSFIRSLNFLPSIDFNAFEMMDRLTEQNINERIPNSDLAKDFLICCEGWNGLMLRRSTVARTRFSFVETGYLNDWLAETEGKECIIDALAPTEILQMARITKHSDPTPEQTTQGWFMHPENATYLESDEGRAVNVSTETVASWRRGPQILTKALVEEKLALSHEMAFTLAAKAENSKANPRITASADHVSRAACSAQDTRVRSLIPPNYGFSQHNESKDRLNQEKGLLKATKNEKTGISSHDVKAWSELENRSFKIQCLKTFDVTSEDKVILGSSNLWNRAYANVTKSYCTSKSVFSGGWMQGISGAFDSIHHQHILKYVLRTWRQTSVDMSKDEQTARKSVGNPHFSLTCIDDVVLEVLSSIKDKVSGEWENSFNKFEKHLYNIYSELGYPLDPLKSIFSCTKSVFLSNLYVNGVKVLTPMKVAPKLKLTFEEIAPSLLDIANAIRSMGTAYCENGGSPQVCYAVMFMQTFSHVALNSGIANREATTSKMLLPDSAGGIGFPTFYEFSMGGTYDRMYHLSKLADAEELEIDDLPNPVRTELTNALRVCFRGEHVELGQDGLTNKPVASIRVLRQKACLQAALKTKHNIFWDNIVEVDKSFRTATESALSKTTTPSYAIAQSILSATPGSVLLTLMDKFTSSRFINGLHLNSNDRRSLMKTQVRTAKKLKSFLIAPRECLENSDFSCVQLLRYKRIKEMGNTSGTDLVVPSPWHVPELLQTEPTVYAIDYMSMNQINDKHTGSLLSVTTNSENHRLGTGSSKSKLYSLTQDIRKQSFLSKVVEMVEVIESTGLEKDTTRQLVTAVLKTWGLKVPKHLSFRDEPKTSLKLALSTTKELEHKFMCNSNLCSHVVSTGKFKQDEFIHNWIDKALLDKFQTVSTVLGYVQKKTFSSEEKQDK